MGSLTMHNYDNNTGLWSDITPENSYISSYGEIDKALMKKYCPELFLKIGSNNIHIKDFVVLRDTLRMNININWYERVIFGLTTNKFILDNQLPILIKAFELFQEEHQTNYYCQEMKAYLEKLQSENNANLVLSFGHTSGGFWGTDSEAISKSIKLELDDDLLDDMGDNVHLSPFAFGCNILE